MAEKEERIYAYYYKKHPCDGCEAKEVYDGCNCPVLEEYEMSITRQEAIERITKAIAIKYFEGVFSCENEEIEEYAKAALNALLDGK